MKLTQQHCQSTVALLSNTEQTALLQQIQGWSIQDNRLSQTFYFPNYYHTMAFVNAIAWIAHQEDHHPDMIIGYGQVIIRLSTHSANGITLNDFICAAKINMLQPQP